MPTTRLSRRLRSGLGRLRLLWYRLRPPQHTVCQSASDWAVDAPGASVDRLHPASTVTRPSPRSLEPEAEEFFASFPGRYEVPAKYLARIPGGMVVGQDGVVVLPDGSFCVESIYEESHLRESLPFRKPLPRRTRVYEGDYYSLLIKFATGANYYHWLHDVALRLYGIVDHLPSDTRFLVPPHRRQFQEDALAVLGIGPDRLTDFDGKGAARFEVLHFSPPSALTGLDSAAAERWFRDQALRAYGLALGPPRRKIYVSRSAAGYRRVANEREVEEVLADFGFESHQMEHYSFREQVDLFAGASVVVSAHGAALTNMMFSPPGLTVVDIFEPTRFNKCFWSMSNALGHRYWYMVGDTVRSGTSFAGDIYLPPAKLREVVSESLAPVG